MSDSGSFIARWSRLKQRAAVQPRDPSPASGGVDGTAGTTAEAVPFDLASLPDIGSIVAGTDIKPFLQAGVPAALTQAALRTTWAADPAIRDFIEIAENQWDFNDPAGIPGFEPIGSADVARGFVGEVPGTLANAPAALAAMAAAVAPPLDHRLEPPREVHVDPVWLSGRRPVESHPDGGPAGPLSGTGHGAEVAARQEPAPATGRRRGHGSALPT
jgi:hypothetical protein